MLDMQYMQYKEDELVFLKNLLPKITKIWPETIVELLKRMSDRESYNQSDDQSADIYLMLARRARTSGLLAESVQTAESWCGVLSRKIVNDSLHSFHSQVKRQ